MIFSDLFFLYFFLPICLICYFAFKDIKYRNLVLIVFSLLFYAWGEPVWMVLLLISTVINYFLGKVITKNVTLAEEKEEESGAETHRARAALVIAILFNIGLLGLFKYTGFFIENINHLTGLSMAVPSFAKLLPLGISFYTFKALSYVIDCYWQKVQAEKSFGKFLLFMTLFPQVTQGPIVRYRTIGEELSVRTTSAEDVSYGINRIIVGLAKKVIIADNISSVVSNLFGGSGISGLSVLGTWYGALMFALQVYFDFSGYSDIAVGLGRIFGFHFEENFNYPFVSSSITEFWQRWHISLGTWFRDYILYVPIFGKRIATLNLFIVWFCTGFWHGASWNYIIWGLFFGLFIFIEQRIGKKKLNKIPKVIMHIYTKIVLIVGFGIFYFENTGTLLDFFKNLIGLNGNKLTDFTFSTIFVNNIFLFAAAILFSIPFVGKLQKFVMTKLGEKNGVLLSGGFRIAINIILLLICSILLVNSTNNPFLYVQW